MSSVLATCLKAALPLSLLAGGLLVHFRGRARLGFWRQLTDHSTLLAPVNALLYWRSAVPATPFLPLERFPELRVLCERWREIRDEALRLESAIRASERYDDAGFNSFFRTGWKRFYLKWYAHEHPSAQRLCPVTTELLRAIPSVKAALFASLPPGARLVRHRDPFAGSLRFHLGVATPNDDRCFIEVDGQRYSWRDGEAVLFDETYLHWAENASDAGRIILFCDVERPMRDPVSRAFSRLVGRVLMGAATAPNMDGDRTGGINRVFPYLYAVRRVGKALKARSRVAYYAAKWALIAGLAALVLLA